MNKHIERVINPRTPSDFAFALQDPFSPVFKEFWNIVAKAGDERSVIIRLVERMMQQQQQIDAEKRAEQYKAERAAYHHQEQTLIQNAATIAKQNQAPAIDDRSVSNEKAELNDLKAIADSVREQSLVLTTKLEELEQAHAKRTQDRVDQTVRIIQERQIQAQNSQGEMLSVAQTAALVKNLPQPSPYSKIAKVNPELFELLEKYGIDGSLKFNNAIAVINFISALFPQADINLKPTEVIAVMNANRTLNLVMEQMHSKYEASDLLFAQSAFNMTKDLAKLNYTLRNVDSKLEAIVARYDERESRSGISFGRTSGV